MGCCPICACSQLFPWAFGWAAFLLATLHAPTHSDGVERRECERSSGATRVLFSAIATTAGACAATLLACWLQVPCLLVRAAHAQV